MSLAKPLNERLSGYIDYGMSDCYIDHVVVNNIRLSFPKYEQSPTVSVLMDQYTSINHGEQLNLKSKGLIIDSSMPLNDITASPEKLHVFQKVLNNINDINQTIEKNFKPEEKQIAYTIFQKVEEHNIKIQLSKPFQEHTSVITVKDRPEIKEQFQFNVTFNTLLGDLVKRIDDMAGCKVKPLVIATKQGATYSQNQFNKSFSQLNVMSHFLTVTYPPILKIGNNQKLRVKLINSIYPKQALDISLKKQNTLLFLLEKVKQITKYSKNPMQIRDSEENIISNQKWGIELAQIVFRKFQLSIIYPPFLNYQCSIQVLHLPQGSQNFTFLIRKTTSLNDIIKYIRQMTNCYRANFEISNSKGQKYQYNIRDKSLHSLQIQEKMFKFMFIRPTCLISSRTKLIIKNIENQKYQEISAQQFFESNSQSQRKILCYNQQKHQPQMGQVSFYKKQQGFPRLCQLSVQGEDQLLKIQCFEESTFITVDFEWKPVFLLEKKQKLIILRKDKTNLFFGQVIDKRIISAPQNTQLYAIQVKPHHNFFANRIIVHNDETVKLNAYFFSQTKEVRQELIECYNENRFYQIQKFKGKRLILGGLTLDNNRTLGDYQIFNFETLFVYDAGYTPKSKEKIVSQWRQKSFEASEVNENLRAKWASECLGLRESNIVELNRDQITVNNTNQPCHLLVAPKIILQKLYYAEQIVSKYEGVEEKAYSQIFKPLVWNNNNYKQKFSGILNNKQIILNEKDALLVYLYTTNLVYRDLNEFLRDKDKKKYSKQILEKWYTLTNLLMKSLDKLPVFQYITVYRGISNICIKSAFNRRQNKDKQSYLILNTFTSTTTDKQVAQGFIAGKGALLTITARCGKDIAHYSHFGQTEKEILLSPFVYFLITKFDPDSQLQQMSLEQIPFPCTNRQKLIFWVDDLPSNNTHIITQVFEPDGIQVVQVISTRIMKVILRDFFGILQAKGRKIVIISDMSRLEQGVWNSQAGVDLFNLIYKEYGMSNKAIIYTMDRNRAECAIAQRGIKKQHWKVCDDERDVVREVQLEFAR